MINFSGEKLMAELRKVEHDIKSVYSSTPHGEVHDRCAAIKSLKQHNRKMARRTYKSNAANTVLEDMETALRLASDLEGSVSDHSIVIRMYRFHFMKARTNFSRWLFAEMPEHSERMMSSSISEVGREEMWLYRLCFAARSMVDIRIREKSFVTHEYGVLLDTEPRTYIARTSRLYANSDDDKIKMASNIVFDVVCTWIAGIDRDDMWRIWVVEDLQTVFGESVLTLDATWDVYRSMTRSSVLKRLAGRSHIAREDMDSFRNAIHEHPLSSHTSLYRTITDHLFSLVSRHTRGELISQAEIPFRPDLSLTASTIYQVPSEQWDGQTRLRLFTLQAVDVHYGTVNPKFKTQLQIEMMSDSDAYSPFRDHTLSRPRFRSKDGPMEADRICTNGGIFSAIVFHAITYCTPFSREGRICFDNADDWINAVRNMPLESYVRRASLRDTFGPEKIRTLARKYSTNIEESQLSSHFSSPDADFWNTFRLLHDTRKKQQPFPQLGASGAFELAVDLAHSGLFDLPTFETTAYCITLMNASSLRGIELYSNVSKSDTISLTPEETCIAMKDAATFLKASVPIPADWLVAYGAEDIEYIMGKFHEATRRGLA